MVIHNQKNFGEKMQKMIFISLILITFVALSFYTSKSNVKKSDIWNNWGKTQSCKVQHIFYPANKQELVDAVKQASKEQRTINAYGSGHSWSNIVCADYLINTDKLNNIIAIDKEKKRAKVQAGIKIYELNKALAKQGLALENLAATTAPSLAGIISTATHGSGHTGTLASFVSEIELITTEGNSLILSPAEHPSEFAAAVTSMGSLGVIYAITVQCVPLFKIKQQYRATSWDDVKSHYQKWHKDHDYFQFTYDPYNEEVIIYTADKVNINDKSGTFAYEVLGKPSHSLYKEEEIAVPIENIIEAAQATINLVKNYEKKGFTIHQILFRFVSADQNNYLSPATGRDVVYISITSETVNEDFYKEFQTIMLVYKGRPHWGKINYLNYDLVHQLYGENLEKFIQVKKKLDPKNIFSPQFTKQILTK